MKFVVIGEPSGASMEAIMAVYPRHKTLVDEFIAQGGGHWHRTVFRSRKYGHLQDRLRQ
jgi:hypothetical protein